MSLLHLIACPTVPPGTTITGSGALAAAVASLSGSGSVTGAASSTTWVGIPDPDWGTLGNPIEAVTPSKPADWSSEVAGFYYVAGGTGSDSGRTYGTPSAPRATVPSTLAAGSIVYVTGTFSAWPQRIQIDGSEANPVWIIGDTVAPTITNGREVIFSGQWMLFENFNFTGDSKFSFRGKDGFYFHNNGCVRNCTFTGTQTFSTGAAVGCSGLSSSARASQIVFYDLNISYYGDYTGPTQNDYHGIKPGRNVDYVWILNSHIHHNGGDSVQISDATIADTDRPSHVYIGGCDLHSNWENDIDIKEADHVIVSGCTCHDSDTSLVVHDQSDNCWFINNYVYSNPQGANVTDGTNIYFVGNVFHDINNTGGGTWNPTSLYSNGACIHFSGGSTGGIINNTFHDTDKGIDVASSNGLVIQNNIFNERAYDTSYDINVAGAVTPNVTMDYNCFYSPTNGVRINWGDSTGRTLASVQSTYSIGLNCIAPADAEITNPGVDWTLVSGADSIDAGTTPSALATFYSTYGIDIDKDILGNAIPQSLAHDIGAMEYT